jgi:hypothetical protein
MLAAEWHGTDRVESAIAAQTGQVLVVDAPAPGVGLAVSAALPAQLGHRRIEHGGLLGEVVL